MLLLSFLTFKNAKKVSTYFSNGIALSFLLNLSVFKYEQENLGFFIEVSKSFSVAYFSRNLLVLMKNLRFCYTI